MFGSKVLAMLALVFVNTAFVTAIIYSSYELRWIVTYVAVLLLYSALYLRRTVVMTDDLRRRLGRTVIALISFLCASFFYSFAADMAWWIAIVVWLGLVVTAYCAYQVIMFEAEAQAERLPV